MPKNVTAKDIIDYERDELGNDGVKVEPGIDPTQYPSHALHWVAPTRNAAKEYGTPEPMSFGPHTIVARDAYGGMLIHHPKAPTPISSAETTTTSEKRPTEPVRATGIRATVDTKKITNNLRKILEDMQRQNPNFTPEAAQAAVEQALGQPYERPKRDKQ
jgi:hypothetical protein